MVYSAWSHGSATRENTMAHLVRISENGVKIQQALGDVQMATMMMMMLHASNQNTMRARA